MPTYSEESARHKLERHRKRGEVGWSMFSCPWGDHWHVVDEETRGDLLQEKES